MITKKAKQRFNAKHVNPNRQLEKLKTKQINIYAGQVIALDCILATQTSGKLYETKQCKHRNRETNNAATKKILYYWEKKL